MPNGTIHNFGTLYVGGTKIPLPTKPWNGTPTGCPSVGNIYTYSSGNVEIKNSDLDDAYKIKWIEVNDNGKKLFISDRNLFSGIGIAQLNALNLISGIEIIIDSSKYKLRMLTGGTNYRNGSNLYAGAAPTTNEWDKIICNEGGFVGLPTPTVEDLNSASNATDYNSASNQLWNWFGLYNACMDIPTVNPSYTTVRGCFGIAYYNYFNGGGTAVGWRPVLEFITDLPLISDTDRDFGNLSSPLIQSYSISDTDSTNLTITEKINGVELRTLTNKIPGDFVLDLTSVWDSLHIKNTNTVQIIVNDNLGGISTRTWTFEKILNPLSNVVLKEFIDRAELLNNEFNYQNFRLGEKLKDKGVEVAENDKMSNLIDKINNINSYKYVKSSVQVTANSTTTIVTNADFDVKDYLILLKPSTYGSTYTMAGLTLNNPQFQTYFSQYYTVTTSLVGNDIRITGQYHCDANGYVHYIVFDKEVFKW